MTVTFNTQLNGVVPKFSLDDDVVIMTEEKSEILYKKFLASQEAKAKVKQYPVSHWWITRVYHTTSDKPPIKWVPANYSCAGTLQDTTDDFVKWISCLEKNSDSTGYKISTMRLDMLNGTGELAKEFCLEHFQPKEKIFINGPKKKPFPAKAAKHYQV
jgi:hypothetical protein